MKSRARTVAVICLALLVLDFFTLENRVVTTNPKAQALGGAIFIAALAGLILSLVGLMLGRRERRAVPPVSDPPDLSRDFVATGAVAPSGSATPASARRRKLRPGKLAIALLVLLAWFVGMPMYLYYSRLVKSADFVPGPWIADAFLSVFALAMQVVVPTPIALAFWPSLFASVYLLFSRKDRPVVDAIFSLVAIGLTVGLGCILLGGNGL